MEFKLVPKMPPPLPPGNANEKPCKNKIASISTRSLHEVPGQDVKKLPIMISRRTPLHSPNTSFNREYLSKTEDNTPVKRCFSQEVIELSRHHIIVTKRSKVGISMLPPKRIRLDDFNRTSTTSKTNRQHHHVPCSSSATSTIITRKENERLKQTENLPFRSSLLRIDGNPSQQNAIDGMMSIPTANVSSNRMVLRKSENPDLSYFLVSIKNFPRNEWKESNYDAEVLREILFLSEVKAAPVSLIRKDDELVIKFTNAGEADFITERSQDTRKGMVLYEILKSPFALTLRALAGVLRWIVGN